jgi:hypothetical protein
VLLFRYSTLIIVFLRPPHTPDPEIIRRTKEKAKMISKSLIVLFPLSLASLGTVAANNKVRGQVYEVKDEDHSSNKNTRRALKSGGKKGKKKGGTGIRAKIDTDLIKATVQAVDTTPGKVEWTVDIDYANLDICPGGAVSWHVHALALDDPDGDGFSGFPGANNDVSVPECVTTRGHWDPSFACGPASDFIGTTCNGLNYPTGYFGRCTSNTPEGCEYGDISSKTGPIDITNTETTQTFVDTFIQTPVADFHENLSLVFHCIGGSFPRVACANFERL